MKELAWDVAEKAFVTLSIVVVVVASLFIFTTIFLVAQVLKVFS